MKKTLFLSIILSLALIIKPNKAEAYVPVVEIIIGIQVATAVAVAAAPYVKKLYKFLKKKGKKFINFVKNHRGKNRVDVLDDETLNRLAMPTILTAANKNLEDKLNPLTLVSKAPHSGGYSHTLKRMEEETNYFAPSAPAAPIAVPVFTHSAPTEMPVFAAAMIPNLPQLEDGFKTVALNPQTTRGYGYSRKVTRYEEETKYFGSGF